jgi:hypothetical protein
MIISICNDLTELKNNPKMVKGGKHRSRIEGSGGGHVHKLEKAGKTVSVVVLTDDAREMLDDIGEFTLLTYEEIFGYSRQVTVDGELQWDADEIEVIPEHDAIEVIGYEDDLTRPIYEVVRHVEETTREVTDMEGNTFTVPGRDIITYETTTNIAQDYDGKDQYQQTPIMGTPIVVIGYEDDLTQPYEYINGETRYMQKPIMGNKVIPEQTNVTRVPIMEDIPAVSESRAAYDAAYPRTPVEYEDMEGNMRTHTPPLIFSIPAGSRSDHLNTE